MAADTPKVFLERDIRKLKGVGEKRAKLYAKLKIATYGDLLRHYPRGYLDYTETVNLMAQSIGSTVTVRAIVDSKSNPVRISGGRTISKVYCTSEDGGELELTYFNNRFAPQKLQIGQEYLFYGKLQGDLLRKQITNPVTVLPEEMTGLTPQYPLTEGLSSRMLTTNIRTILNDPEFGVEESLPVELIDRYRLPSGEDALRMIHFPVDQEDIRQAKRRLVFEELLLLSLGMKLRKQRRKVISDNVFACTDPEPFIRSLPFQLTGAQKRSIAEIASDLGRNEPMSRLLQGDVGSGKTVVAAAAVWLAWRSGYQSAVMVPTEVLASQHAETFRAFLEPFGITVGLLTGSVKGKPRTELLNQIARGGADLIVGTHALISEGVDYRRLGLVITDEQHRFGVNQRAALTQKGKLPHTLVMSATPIPRTLSLILYGDLELSVLDELPSGRKPIRTLLVDDSYRDRYLGFVRKTVSEGQQAYIVCPLVEDSEALTDTMSATEYYEQLRKGPLNGIPVALVHGKMLSQEKAEVMERFRTGKVRVLVSTTVIEVGVDCPNATLMIIENAERFGLSTLHQLRGRVGRGALQSWCVLVSSNEGETAQERLKLLTETEDGFAIAREDLRMRGPGDFLGSRQHGLPNLTVADLADDERVLIAANDAADELIRKDPDLSGHPVLKKNVEHLYERTDATIN